MAALPLCSLQKYWPSCAMTDEECLAWDPLAPQCTIIAADGRHNGETMAHPPSPPPPPVHYGFSL